MRCILKDASIEFGSEKLIGIVGRSDLGKTTIIKLLMGIEEVDSGKILVGEECVNTSDEQSLVKLRRHTIGYVFKILIPLTPSRYVRISCFPVTFGVKRMSRQRLGEVEKTYTISGVVEKLSSQMYSGIPDMVNTLIAAKVDSRVFTHIPNHDCVFASASTDDHATLSRITDEITRELKKDTRLMDTLRERDISANIIAILPFISL